MTLIELVAALALFVIILGSLLTLMNSATALWSSSRSQQREQTAAQNISSFLINDLNMAITDNGTASNSATSSIKPTFMMKTPSTNNAVNEAVIVLGFARHASPRTLLDADIVPDHHLRVSLDAVFYTYYKNALFRHVIPLSYVTSTETLADLLETQRSRVMQVDHKLILESLKNPVLQTHVKWNVMLLAERIELGLLATLPGNYDLNMAYSQEAITLSELKANVLPDRLDIAGCIFSIEDWKSYQALISDTSNQATLKKKHLGVLFSKRITFPAQGGSRLP